MKKKDFVILHQNLKKPHTFSFYNIIILISLCVIISATIFYFVGQELGYNEKTKEINKQKQIDLEKKLMEKDVQEVKEIFYKYLMVKGMVWLPLIIIALLVGWIIHGLF